MSSPRKRPRSPTPTGDQSKNQPEVEADEDKVKFFVVLEDIKPNGDTSMDDEDILQFLC